MNNSQPAPWERIYLIKIIQNQPETCTSACPRGRSRRAWGRWRWCWWPGCSRSSSWSQSTAQRVWREHQWFWMFSGCRWKYWESKDSLSTPGLLKRLIRARIYKLSFEIGSMWLTNLTRNKIIFFCYIVLSPQLHAEIEPRLHPLHAKVKPKCDGVVFVINAEHIGNLKTCKLFKWNSHLANLTLDIRKLFKSLSGFPKCKSMNLCWLVTNSQRIMNSSACACGPLCKLSSIQI